MFVNNLLRLHHISAAQDNESSSFNAIMVSLGLVDWAERLSSTCRHHLAIGENSYPSSSIALQKFILHMIYHIMHISLHRYFRDPNCIHSPNNKVCQEDISTNVCDVLPEW